MSEHTSLFGGSVPAVPKEEQTEAPDVARLRQKAECVQEKGRTKWWELPVAILITAGVLGTLIAYWVVTGG